MRHAILSMLILTGCAQSDPSHVQTTETTQDVTGSWVNPLTGFTFRIGFNIVNPSAPGFGSCFGKPLSQLVHAGEDWGTAAGTAVRAIGPGTVVFSAFANYPGSVIVIRHDLTAAERSALGISQTSIFSQYGHLTGLLVGVGATVSTGQRIASVLDQASNSHLHWEVRTVQIPQLCGFNAPGPGYTDSGTDARNFGYRSPSGSVSALANATSTPVCGSGLFCAANQILGSSACLSGSQTIFCCPFGQNIVNGVCSGSSTQACGSGLFCAANQIPGSSACLSGSTTIFCCPSGQTIVNGACSGSAPPPCGSGLFCAANQIPGSSACTSNSTTIFCCASGHTIVNGACS